MRKTTTAILLGSAMTMSGCGTLIGGGIGAIAGQAIGGNTASTLIGAGIGAGAGLIVDGIENDKKQKQIAYERQVEEDERMRYEAWRREEHIRAERRGMTTKRVETRRILNPDGTVTETGTETITSEQELGGYSGLPR